MKATEFKLEDAARAVRLEHAGGLGFLVLHDTEAGRCYGGIRTTRYQSEHDAQQDALALAQAMTRKLRIAELPGGGAKTVLMGPLPDRPGFLTALGEFIESLDGLYTCGGDLGFSEADHALVSAQTQHIAGTDLSRFTAESVVRCLTMLRPEGEIFVEGLGAVGSAAATMLVESDHCVTAYDPGNVPTPAAVFRLDHGAWPEDAAAYVPCAGSYRVDKQKLTHMSQAILCGGANNPLAKGVTPADVHEAQVIYVPDFIANAGATVAGVLRSLGREEEIGQGMTRLLRAWSDVYGESEETGRSTHQIALERIQRA